MKKQPSGSSLLDDEAGADLSDMSPETISVSIAISIIVDSLLAQNMTIMHASLSFRIMWQCFGLRLGFYVYFVLEWEAELACMTPIGLFISMK